MRPEDKKILDIWESLISHLSAAGYPTDPRKTMQTDLHNALADSYFQAKAIQVAYSHLYAKINNTQGLSVNPSNSAAHII